MGRPKPWLPLGGIPMLAHMAARVRPLVREIVIVAAAGQDLPAIDARIVRDPTPDLGPLPALALGLTEIATPFAFALGCDTPFVRRALLARLLDLCRDANGVVPFWDERPQPLVAVYHRRFAAPVADLAAGGERRLAAVVSLPGVRVVTADDLAPCDPGGVSFRTVNTPEEYTAAVEAWAAVEPGEE